MGAQASEELQVWSSVSDLALMTHKMKVIPALPAECQVEALRRTFSDDFFFSFCRARSDFFCLSLAFCHNVSESLPFSPSLFVFLSFKLTGPRLRMGTKQGSLRTVLLSWTLAGSS